MDKNQPYLKPKYILPQLFVDWTVEKHWDITSINDLRMTFYIRSPITYSKELVGKMQEITKTNIIDLFHGPCIWNSSFVKLVWKDWTMYDARNPYDNPFNKLQWSYPLITNFTHSLPDYLTQYETTFLEKMLTIDGKIQQQLWEILIQMPTTQYRLYLYYWYIHWKIDKNLYEDYMKFLDEKVDAYKTEITKVLSEFKPKKITFYEREKEWQCTPDSLLDQQLLQKDPDILRQMIHESYLEWHYQLAKNSDTIQVIVQDGWEKVQLDNLDRSRLEKPILWIYWSHKHLLKELSTWNYSQNFYFTKE